MEAITRRPVSAAAEELLGAYMPVLDHGFIALIDYMGSDESVERGARLSYQEGTRPVSDTRTLLRYLSRHRHTSPFEAVKLSFHVACPIFVARQWIRHRTGSFNELSGRYSIMPTAKYTPRPEHTMYQATENKQGRQDPVSEEMYSSILSDMEFQRGIIDATYSAWVSNGLARELARVDLPLSTYTAFQWTTDLHNLFHFLGLRIDPHAQFEIREYATVLLALAHAVAPLSTEAFLDYRANAVTFSRQERELLSRCLHGKWTPDMLESPDYRTSLEHHATHLGLSKRELREFLHKLLDSTRISVPQLPWLEALTFSAAVARLSA